MNTVPITPDADVLYQTFHLSKKLLELDSIFGVNLINAYLNSYNKEVLVPLLEELIKVHLREIVKKYTPEYMQSEFNEKDHNFYNYANINANINHLYPVLLYGYYGDEYSKYVSFSKDILPYKIDIQEIKDLIRIILSIIYDITFFEYYWAVYQCLTDKSPSLSYWGLLFKKVRQDPKNSGYILSPRYRSKAGFFKFLK